ncbi:MAG: site-specific integrase [Archangium sp.]|nr:site-specific integrase [Archangium sp.]
MSVPDRRTPPLTGRGETPSQERLSLDAEPPEYDVGQGSIEVRREVAALELGGINIDQLALALAERLKPVEVERPFFGELAEGWLEHIRGRRVAPGNEERLLRRLKPLYLEDERTLTAQMVSDLIDAQADYSASTKNKLRGAGRKIVEWAQASQRWDKPNPFALVKREKEGRRKYELLTLQELYEVQLHLRADRLREFRVSLHLGLRPGELMGLRVEDIDFANNIVHVRVSRDRDTTKTGTTREIPLHPAVHVELLDACVESKGELVFGHHLDGTLQSQNTKLTRILRTAMVKANVGVLGADWKCRRKGCGFSEYRQGPVDKRRRFYCPKCEFRLLAVPLVREVRWYDLRHMCSNFHHEAGADRVCRKIAMGHSLDDITDEVYTHPTMATMAVQLSKWKLSKPPRK